MNFKSVIILSLTFLLVVSCQEKKDKIEIYLLNKRIVSSEGIPIEKLEFYDSISSKGKELYKDCVFDLKDSCAICSGKFEVKNEDINHKPLVDDKEVLSFNLKENSIKISKNGVEKISCLEPNYLKGVQFVVCVNKEPKFTGYFSSVFSSYLPTWNFLSYLPQKQSKGELIKEEDFVVRRDSVNSKVKVVDVSKEYPELIQAFKNTNRLLEE